ncbi:hypothetical protein F2Q69_00029056 [Brassica cretica]|uniref:Uncharacterized protein n=1 Tax=Brassica cretica TaxID=69181 RepID=A0A8S9S3Z1_BRACR|nr:hypothetical protein F2Q69_00029056 [Brassica cretica]
MKREPIVDSASLQSSTLETEASGHGEFSNPSLRFEGWALLGGCSPPNINRSLLNPKHQGEIVEILKNLRGIVNYDDNKSRGEGLVGYGKKFSGLDKRRLRSFDMGDCVIGALFNIFGSIAINVDAFHAFKREVSFTEYRRGKTPWKPLIQFQTWELIATVDGMQLPRKKRGDSPVIQVPNGVNGGHLDQPSHETMQQRIFRWFSRRRRFPSGEWSESAHYGKKLLNSSNDT